KLGPMVPAPQGSIPRYHPRILPKTHKNSSVICIAITNSGRANGTLEPCRRGVSLTRYFLFWTEVRQPRECLPPYTQSRGQIPQPPVQSRPTLPRRGIPRLDTRPTQTRTRRASGTTCNSHDPPR